MCLTTWGVKAFSSFPTMFFFLSKAIAISLALSNAFTDVLNLAESKFSWFGTKKSEGSLKNYLFLRVLKQVF